MSLLVVGSLALDSVATPYGQCQEVLGGSASYLATSASFWTKVHACGVVGTDFPQEHLDFFAARNVDMGGVERGNGRTFRWRGQYGYDLNQAQTLETQLNVFATFRPTVPAQWCGAGYAMLGNFGPEAQGHVLDQLQAPDLVACDTMNYWIAGHTRELKQTLSRVGMLCINEAEARQLTGQQQALGAARAIAQLGPSRVVIKRGEYGALVVADGEVFAVPAFPLENVVDPTGAGDSFAGGLMGYLAEARRVDAATLRQAVMVGGCMASFVVEDFSLNRLRWLTRADLGARLAAYEQLVRVAPLAPQQLYA